MHRRYTMRFQRPDMACRRVTHVAGEPVLWITSIQDKHSGIANRLGQNRRGGDRGDFTVALDHRLDRHRQFRAAIAIDQRAGRPDCKCGHGTPHGEHWRRQELEAAEERWLELEMMREEIEQA